MQTQQVTSEDIEQSQDGDDVKMVPVAESIRYRKRAQSAEKKIEELTEQLAQAQQQSEKLSGQLSDIRAEQELMRKVISAGAVDVESAVLLAKARMQDKEDSDADVVIEQLKKEKQYLFEHTGKNVTVTKTAGAKERDAGVHTILEKAAKKAAATGSRTDLHEYLKLRRNYI
jgi:predicted  nucleic acid-binding Zn-ribbon protein